MLAEKRMRLLRIGVFASLLLLGMLLCVANVRAQSRDSVLDKRVEYLYHFSQEVTWPNFARQEKFYVELIGRNADFYAQLKRFFQDKEVRGKEVSVSNTLDWRTRNRAIRPNIVYVDETFLHYLPMIVSFFEGYPVLIVSSRPYMEKGWMVSFTERFLEKPYREAGMPEWGYSLNCETIETQARLSISSRLRNGALLVIPVQRQEYSQGTNEELRGMASKIDAMRFELFERDSIVRQRDVEILNLLDTIDRQKRQLEHLDSFAAVRFLTAAEFLKGYSRYDYNSLRKPDIGVQIHAKRGALVLQETTQVSTYTFPWSDIQGGYVLTFFALAFGVFGVVLSYFLGINSATTELAADAKIGRESHGVGEKFAERQLRIQNAFLANVSHELRTPLNAIVGLSQLLVSGDDVEENEMKASLDIINQSAHGLLRMMDSVITKAMIDAGQLSLHETLGNPLPMLITLSRESEELLQNIGKREVVKFRRELGPKIPKLVFLDFDKVQSILGVLLSNAVRFTSLGEVVLGCNVCQKSESSYIKFFVEDTGRGMNAEQVEMVALHFKGRGETVVPHDVPQDGAADSGMGLGLSIACGLAQIMGTELQIESKPGLGTHVAFELPLRTHAEA